MNKWVFNPVTAELQSVPDISSLISGSGTINTVPKFTVSSTIGNSAITDDAATIGAINRALNFSGTTGATPTSGAGTRMMWIPGKKAFRAGSATGTEWDAANIGTGSAAFGQTNKASGINSAAFGSSNTASGSRAICFGASNTATNSYSFAAGLLSNCTGVAAFTTGFANNVSGDYATGLGTTLTVSGFASCAIGDTQVITSDQSVSLGSYNTITGLGGIVVGSNVTLSGILHTVIGSVDGAATYLSKDYCATLLVGETLPAFQVEKATRGFIHTPSMLMGYKGGTLGAELVTNGTFTGSATGWTLGTGWVYNSGTADKNADGLGTVTQVVSGLKIGHVYLLKWDMQATSGAGGITPSFPGMSLTFNTVNAFSADNYEIFIATATSGTLTFTPTDTTLRTVLDNISLKEVQSGDLAIAGTLYANGNVIIADAKNIVLDTTTGTKIGTGTTQKLGFWNTTPIVQPSAFTQTYSTATKTHAVLTSAVLTDSTGGTADTVVADVGLIFNQATLNNNFADLIAQINALRIDLTNLKQVVNAVIDDGQSVGLLA